MSEEIINNEVVTETPLVTEQAPIQEPLTVAQEFEAAKQEQIELSKPKEEIKDPTPIEKEAMEMGWKPPGQFDSSKEGKRALSAEEYVDRRSLYKRIDSYRDTAEKAKEAVVKLGEHLKKTEEAAYRRALETLNAQRADAFNKQDAERFNEIEAKMNATQQEFQERINIVQPESVAYKPTQEEAAFITRNEGWFNSKPENADIVDSAKRLDQYWTLKRPELSNSERLVLVEGDIKREFPERFEKKPTRRDEPPAVATNTEKASPKGDKSAYRLSDRQKSFARQMIDMGVFKNESEYAAQLDLQGVLRHE